MKQAISEQTSVLLTEVCEVLERKGFFFELLNPGEDLSTYEALRGPNEETFVRFQRHSGVEHFVIGIEMERRQEAIRDENISFGEQKYSLYNEAGLCALKAFAEKVHTFSEDVPMTKLPQLKAIAAEYGYKMLNRLTETCGDLVLATEAANHLAKETKNEAFYGLKTELALAAISAGAWVGWGEVDKHGRLLMLAAHATGTISLHIKEAEQGKFTKYNLGEWSYPWHRVYRQQWVLESIASPTFREKMALATQPGALWTEQPLFAEGNAADFLTKLTVT